MSPSEKRWLFALTVILIALVSAVTYLSQSRAIRLERIPPVSDEHLG